MEVVCKEAWRLTRWNVFPCGFELPLKCHSNLESLCSSLPTLIYLQKDLYLPKKHFQNWTRLTYNCAHLRLNNKKNKNKLSQKGPREWALVLEKSVLTNFSPFQTISGRKYFCQQFFVLLVWTHYIIHRQFHKWSITFGWK